MKRILLLIIILLLCGCSINGKINEKIEIKNNNCKIKESVDTHDGFLGDGEYFAKIECKDLKESELSNHWRKLPMSKTIIDVLSIPFCDDRGCKNFYERYNISNDVNMKGYYFFYDRYSKYDDRYNEYSLDTRASYNFDVAIYDIENNVIYYYKLDT